MYVLATAIKLSSTNVYYAVVLTVINIRILLVIHEIMNENIIQYNLLNDISRNQHFQFEILKIIVHLFNTTTPTIKIMYGSP